MKITNINQAISVIVGIEEHSKAKDLHHYNVTGEGLEQITGIVAQTAAFAKKLSGYRTSDIVYDEVAAASLPEAFSVLRANLPEFVKLISAGRLSDEQAERIDEAAQKILNTADSKLSHDVETVVEEMWIAKLDEATELMESRKELIKKELLEFDAGDIILARGDKASVMGTLQEIIKGSKDEPYTREELEVQFRKDIERTNWHFEDEEPMGIEERIKAMPENDYENLIAFCSQTPGNAIITGQGRLNTEVIRSSPYAKIMRGRLDGIPIQGSPERAEIYVAKDFNKITYHLEYIMLQQDSEEGPIGSFSSEVVWDRVDNQLTFKPLFNVKISSDASLEQMENVKKIFTTPGIAPEDFQK